MRSVSVLELDGEHKQTDVGCNTQSSQNRDYVSTGPELLAVQAIFAHFGEELLISCTSLVGSLDEGMQLDSTFMSAQQAREQDASPVHGEKGANGIEFGSEDL